MKNHKLIIALSCITLSTVALSGCSLFPGPFDTSDSGSNHSTNQKKRTEQLQDLAHQKQQLTEKLWSLQNTKIIALNKSDLKTLSKIKSALFNTQSKLTTATGKMATLNKVMRQRYHHAVLDDGQVINTWALLKTDDSKTNHERARILIGKMKKLQKDQQEINEKLWDDQNQITIALNHNDQTKLESLKSQYFKDRTAALPIANKIDMLAVQISKFTTDLQKPSADIRNQQMFNDWIIFQTITNNNQRLNQTITPADPNDDVNTTHVNSDEDEDHVGSTEEEENPTGTHTTTGTTTDEENTTTHTTTTTGGGEGGGEATGGGAHGE